jgi:hypothetical protein
MNNVDKYYNSFGLDKSIPKSFIKKQELNNIFAVPKKEQNKDMAHFYNFVENDTHMADVLFLPWDRVSRKLYAYALIVVDVATGNTDGEPLEKKDEYEITDEGKQLKTKWSGPTPEDTTIALNKIYKRGTYLKKPNLLITDSGKEFNNEIFQNYLEKNGITWKKSVGGRSRQVALAERRNYTIGRAIAMKQQAISMITQKENRQWFKDFPTLIYWVNKRFHHKPPTDESLFKQYGDPWLEKKKILPIGTVVRVKLTQPKDFKERGIKGKFRASDARWTQDTYKITGFLFDPHSPILYKINMKLKPREKAAYTREQLKVVADDEEDVPATITTERPDNEEYRIKKLIDKRQRGTRTEYKTLWYGFPLSEATWEYKSKLPKSFVNSYEESNHH